MNDQDTSAELPILTRRIFCNRTLNLRASAAVGLDMDYTLVHYDTGAWESRAYEYVQRRLLQQGWPVGELRFDPTIACLGLVLDLELGNAVKANRFGHVRRASHGTRMLSFEERRETYGTAPFDLGSARWVPMDTSFSLSEACLFMQLVDLFDERKLTGVKIYRDVYESIKEAMDATHLEGKLKGEIIQAPERFVVLDEELPLTLHDLKRAGKKLLLITNSEWEYTHAMMAYCFDRFLPEGETWRSLFDLIVVQARKPSFFSGNSPAMVLADESGLFRPWIGPLQSNQVYLGASAQLVEQSLGLRGDSILYIGDHIFADVYASKDLLRWRTALVLRELEGELEQLVSFQEQQEQLRQMMYKKERWEHQFSQWRIQLQRSREGYGPKLNEAEVRKKMHRLRSQLVKLDEEIAPLAREASELVNHRWGPLLRSGTDKSYLARQIERFADIYMSRVSNLLAYTPFVYLRAPSGTLPHEVSIAEVELDSESLS